MSETQNIQSKNKSIYKRNISSIHPEMLMEHGKVTPQAIEIEEAFLGALMLEKDAYLKVAEFIFPEVFYKPHHQMIYNAIINLSNRLEPIDLLSVTQELKRLGQLETIGGSYYLAQLTYKVASAANIEYYGRVLLQKYLQRETITICTDAVRNAFEDSTDIFELIDYTTKSIFELIEKVTKSKEKNIKALMQETIKEIKDASSAILTGVPCGLKAIDTITNGWQKSHFIILAARPGMGKSALMLNFAKNAAFDYNKGVAIFSLEMSASDLVKRLLAATTQIPLYKINNATLENYEIIQLMNSTEKLDNVPLYIDDTPGLSLTELRAKARRLKNQYNIELIIVDYLQLMSNRDKINFNSNREQEISSISRGLKGIAKELNITVIALSQVNRAVEKEKENKMPRLSDLRESGSLEQDADMVMFIYRPEYYTKEDTPPEFKDMAFLNIAKNRHGKTCEIKLKFLPEYGKFADYDEFEIFGDGVSFNTDITSMDQNIGNRILPSKINQKNDEEDGGDISRYEIEEDF